MAKKKSTIKHFEVVPLLKKFPKCRYYFIIGARGIGKTYPVIRQCLKDAIDGKGVFAYVRRYKESITGRNLKDTFSPHNEWLAEYTKGAWNRLSYWQGRFYLELWEPNPDTGILEKTAKNPTPIGGAWAMSTWETDKGQDFAADKGGIAHIVIDEVISQAGLYLPNEWSICQNVISSLVRDRWEKDTKIWMLANPLSKWANPYFRNMGITKNLLENPGTTLIEYPDENGKTIMSALFVYVVGELDSDKNRAQIYNTFFAFPNSKGKSKSITHGIWEMEDSAQLPPGVYKESTKNRTIYLSWNNELIAVDIMKNDITSVYYLFVYPTKELKEKHYFITLDMSMSKYAIIGITSDHPIYNLFKKIHNTGQVYYADNTIADAFHGFLLEARKRAI